MSIIEWFITIFVVVIVIAVVQAVNSSQKKKGMEAELDQLKDFTANHKFMGNDGSTGIAIDETQKKSVFITS